MCTMESILLYVICFAGITITSCKPIYNSNSTRLSLVGAPCHMTALPEQPLTSLDDIQSTEQQIMCNRVSSELPIKLLILSYEASRVKSKIINDLVASDYLMGYINSSVQYQQHNMTCDNFTDYLVYVFEEITNVSTAIDEIKTSNSCSGNIFVHLLKDNLAEVPRLASQTTCSMVTAGLHRIIDISILSTGAQTLVSECSDPILAHVPAMDVLRMIYQLVVTLEQTTKQAYDDITGVCEHRTCVNENKISAGIVG